MNIDDVVAMMGDLGDEPSGWQLESCQAAVLPWLMGKMKRGNSVNFSHSSSFFKVFLSRGIMALKCFTAFEADKARHNHSFLNLRSNRSWST